MIITLPLIPKPIVRQVSSRYIAGEETEDAIRVVQSFSNEGFLGTLDILGEHVDDRERAVQVTDAYANLLNVLQEKKLKCNISVKPTHLGLKLDYNLCRDNLRRLVAAAKERENFVRIDMEDASCTDDSLRIYLELRKDFDNLGIVIQSYLRRSLLDIRRVMSNGIKINVRLCKGIYVEPRSIAYKDREIINKNFVMLLRELLSRKMYVGIATHDEKLVWDAFKIIDELKISPEDYEFQMLLGVDSELRRIIRNSGHRLRVYVPYGREWYAYSTRRLKENPQVTHYVIQNFFNRSRG
jgi:proline dehydrogenase